MRLNMATRFSAAIIGVTILAAASSSVALVSLWRTGRLMQQLDVENEHIVRTAEGLDDLLLEQKGLVSTFILSDGNRSWLDKLQTSKQQFAALLASARSTAHTDQERETLNQLAAVYQRLDAGRSEVIARYQKGDTAAAKETLLANINRDRYDQAYALCEDFITASEQYADAIMAGSEQEIRAVTWLVIGCVGLTIALGSALLILFFRGVLFPLRHVVADARAFAGERAVGSQTLAIDELRAVGLYLRTLMSDVTDARSALEQSRAQLLNAEKMASVGKLAAGVAHEIRNPLTAIKMWLFSIRKVVGVDADLDRRFEIVSEEIGRLESIIRNFLEFARPPALKLREESLAPLIDKTLELFTPRLEGERIRLVRNDAPALPPVLVDPEQIRQVWINLLNNAAEAAGDERNERKDGEIRVQTAVETGDDGRKMVVLRVQNTGRPMPPEVRQRIFEPFFTTKDSGTGLGLCIAARIVAQHQGRLVLEASTDDHTSFAVLIPASRGEPR
jgi:signal transduction histidine kinase